MIVFKCPGVTVEQTTDGKGEPVAKLTVYPGMSTLTPQDILAMAERISEAFEGFRGA